MALAPIDYGPQVVPDTQGVAAAQQAVAQHQQVFAAAHQLGAVVEGGAEKITQGILHTQALKATAAAKERQASTLQFIDSNPYVPKAVLQQRMTPEDYTAWHAGLATEYQKAEAVPMFTAAPALFDSESAQARGEAGKIISLPGWRGAWEATERTESATIKERYVTRLAADQMIADQRAQALAAIDVMVDNAVKPQDMDIAVRAAETNPWLKPAERRIVREKALVARDSFTAEQAMLGGDTDVMQSELAKLRGANAEKAYPNMNVKQRLNLVNKLTRESGFKFAKDEADKIVGANVAEGGKVDHDGIEADLADYKGPNKADVVKATKAEMAERDAIFSRKMSDVQQVVLKAGQDPMTAEFSYARAMRNPEARKAALQLNEDAAPLLTALSKEDQRNVNIESRATALERRELRQKLIEHSGEQLEDVHRQLDDPAQSVVFRSMTAAQFDSGLYQRAMTEQDRGRARTAFAAFIKAGKPDERPTAAVKAEISEAAKGDPQIIKNLTAKYADRLLEEARKFIREAPPTPPDKLADEVRKFVREKMLAGDVRGTGWIFTDRTRRIDWESNPKYAGKDFELADGTVITTSEQRSTVLTSPDGKQSGTFSAADAAVARSKGWK